MMMNVSSWVTSKHGVNIVCIQALVTSMSAHVATGAAHVQTSRRGRYIAMIRPSQKLLIISAIVTLLLLYITISHKTNFDIGTLTEPEEPHKYIPGLIQDKTMKLGTLITHVLHPERRESVIVPELDPGIMVSVKTTAQYHRHRLSLLLFTWMQTLSPQQLVIVTDGVEDDIWVKEAKLSGIHVSKADCPAGHTSDSLCCKSGHEFNQFYTALETGKQFRWFCHFDDDEYLNIGALSKHLKSYNFSSDYYIGHWLTKHGNKPKTLGNFKNFPETKQTNYFYATGASYCISLGLMRKVEKYFRGELFVSTCDRIGLTDDYTLGAVIGGVMGINLTEASTMLSQGEDFTHFTTTQLRNMITVSSKANLHNSVRIPHSAFSKAEDPMGFLSYHCLLYPQVSWCHNQTLHIHKSDLQY